MTRKIGLFGGSFDPVHYGHLLVAQAAVEEMGLDRLYFIPAAQSPFKPDSNPCPGEKRAAMLRLALCGHSQFEVDDQELKRGGVSFTVDTLRHYHEIHPEAELYWLIGADHLSQLHRWRAADAIRDLAVFVVVPRPGEQAGQPPDGFRIRRLKGHLLDLSSSEIRDRIARRRPLAWLAPPEVEQFIHNNALYL